MSRRVTLPLLLALAAAIPACTSCQPGPTVDDEVPFTVQLGTSAFSGKRASLVARKGGKELWFILSEELTACDAVLGGSEDSTAGYFAVLLTSTSAGGFGASPGPGKYSVSEDPTVTRKARVIRRLAKTTCRALNERPADTAASGTVTLDFTGADIAAITLDVVLASGTTLTGSVTAQGCPANSFGGNRTCPPLPDSPFCGGPAGGGTFAPTITVDSVSPTRVFVEGGEPITLRLSPGCKVIQDVTLSGTSVPFTADVSPFGGATVIDVNSLASPGSAAREVAVVVTCALDENVTGRPFSPCDPSTIGTIRASYTADPSLEPLNKVIRVAPLGPSASLPALPTVTFARSLDPASVTIFAMGVEGVAGAARLAADQRTIVFEPTSAFAPCTAHSASLKVGSGGPLTALGRKQIDDTTFPDGVTLGRSAATWSFVTACEP